MLILIRLITVPLIALCCLVLAGRVWIQGFHELQVHLDELNVPDGSTASEVLMHLAPNFSSHERAIVFLIYPKYAHLQQGNYAFGAGATVIGALNKIHHGEALLERLTVPEGITAKELFVRIAKHNALSGDVRFESSRWNGLAIDWPSHEGAFLAETYLWQQVLSRDALLKKAHMALTVALNQAWETADPVVTVLLKSPYELLILASIVEKETALDHERPRIAGVFLERLKQKMRLQTDPTVIYGLGDRFNGNLTRNNLRELTAYNTYRIARLPPTPIALVGPKALMAVSKPKFTGDLYFVADGTGGHVFSSTLAEHNANVRKYQLKR